MGSRPDTALVLGLGRSGRAAANLLLNEGVQVTAIDGGRTDELRNVADEFAARGADVRLGVQALPAGSFDLCVTSPGVPSTSEWIAGVQSQGTRLISELELGASRARCPLLAVTGTNGKSTFAKLCGDALAAASMPAVVAGNYGYPLCDAVSGLDEFAWIVVEVSSFQLEHVSALRPRVAVLLNVEPDHLDRHADMSEYRALKARLFARQAEGDAAVVPWGEQERVASLSGGRPRWLTFGHMPQADYRYSEGVVRSVHDGEETVSVRGTLFDNGIMGNTAAAAAAALRRCGVEISTLERTFSSFEPLPHRMQTVAVSAGVRFINDSKATNLAALRAGLQTAGGRTHLIAGGRLKEGNLDSLKEVLVSRVKAAYVIGESCAAMVAAWSDAIDCHACGCLDEAVRSACERAVSGDIVLLSPGCASFDQFRNYEDRGNQFCRLVRLYTGCRQA